MIFLVVATVEFNYRIFEIFAFGCRGRSAPPELLMEGAVSRIDLIFTKASINKAFPVLLFCFYNLINFNTFAKST
jgi:hypothetical protein